MAENTTRTSPRDFMSEVVEQVKKVTWPDRAQLQSSTGIIVAFMLGCALLIFAMDYAIRAILELAASLFGG